MDDGTKKWYTSKLIWAGLLTFVASLLQAKYGYVMDGATQGVILGLVVVILRVITKEEITW